MSYRTGIDSDPGIPTPTPDSDNDLTDRQQLLGRSVSFRTPPG
ncbi:MAG: hypothetical protein ACOX52_06335 [Verrucomicrobiota bacterium]